MSVDFVMYDFLYTLSLTIDSKPLKDSIIYPMCKPPSPKENQFSELRVSELWTEGNSASGAHSQLI